MFSTKYSHTFTELIMGIANHCSFWHSGITTLEQWTNELRVLKCPYDVMWDDIILDKLTKHNLSCKHCNTRNSVLHTWSTALTIATWPYVHSRAKAPNSKSKRRLSMPSWNVWGKINLQYFLIPVLAQWLVPDALSSFHQWLYITDPVTKTPLTELPDCGLRKCMKNG